MATPETFKPAEKKKFHFSLSSVPFVEKIFFVQNLGLMIKTGFSIGDALSVLAAQSKSKMLKKAVFKLQEDVVAGETFSSALQKHSNIFDELFINMVGAGEISGNLEDTLRQITVQMKKSYALKKKIRNAMIYPSLILVVMVVMGTLIFIFVIPRILDLYSGDQSTIPIPTRIVLAMSTFMREQYLLIIGGMIVFSFSFYATWKTESGRYLISKVMLRIPIFGPIIKKISIARITRILHSLIVTEIPIVRSFQIISHTVGNRIYRRHMIEASEKLTKGNSMYSTIADRADIYDPVIAQMIKVGEDTGSIDTMTEEIALFYEDEVESTMANLTVIIEPVLMIFIGLGVGFLAVAIIMPIYGLVDQI